MKKKIKNLIAHMPKPEISDKLMSFLFRHRNALVRALTTLKAPTWDFTMNFASSKGRMAIEYSGPQKVNKVIPYDCSLFSW